ncbi:MAG: type III-A CRISPR-associated protein Cas10/Csm1 [Sphaerochaetaceae bacterium]|nr:type III-A CRISPR-associated protein Cas10/Csm1 [Spirochaetales bacterium]MDY5500209.1 type III-A CRISPR-associated protein Cas10/Csm1 [Sphaerochaetaceae bacterium]
MLETKKQYELAIAALCHDLGKFKQRAFGGDEKSLSRDVVSMEGQLLPTSMDARYTYRHALWTYGFFLEDFFPIIRQLDLDLSIDWELVARESAMHHNPSSDGYSHFVAMGDRLSAGADRVEKEIGLAKDAYLKTPLRAVFPNVRPNQRHTSTKSTWVYAMRPFIEGQDVMFPSQNLEEAPDYHNLWRAFKESLSSLQGKISCQMLVRKLKDLLFTYCWCIPSATNDGLNDISLYDHSVMTMTIALAMANSENAQKPFRLVVGDLSGIQKFIFQSKSESFRGASKTFRGRSFIISLLSTAYQVGLCDRLGLIPFVDMIDAGGRFTLLLPNFDGIEKQIEAYQTEQDVFFLKKYLGTLCIVIDASQEIGMDGFSAKTFRKTLAESSALLMGRKTRKFERALPITGFVLSNVNVEGTRCPACGVRSSDTEDGFCTECRQEGQIGGHIPDMKEFHLAVTTASDSGFQLLSNVVFAEGKGEQGHVAYAMYASRSEILPIWHLNAYTPHKEFSEIARMGVSDEGQGRALLAYVKIDVDHLGDIFIDGLPDDAYTLSRYVTLSRQLHMFFNMYLHSLLEKSYPDVYTVITGGDDVFLITPWNQAVPLVQQLHSDFSKYCCMNPDFHFSVGISIQGAKAPFSFGNRNAGDALDVMAKEAFGRNCVCFMGDRFSYEELAKLMSDKDTLKSYLTDSRYPVSTAFLYRMLGYVKDRLSGDTARRGSSIGKMRYDIARNFDKDDSMECRLDAVRFFQARFEYADASALRRFEHCLEYVLDATRDASGGIHD